MNVSVRSYHSEMHVSIYVKQVEFAPFIAEALETGFDSSLASCRCAKSTNLFSIVQIKAKVKKKM